MEVFVDKATSSVKIMSFCIDKIDMSKFLKLQYLFFVYSNKAVYKHEKTANLQ